MSPRIEIRNTGTKYEQGVMDRYYYFTVHASNGQEICRSEKYMSRSACENGVSALQKYVPMAEVVYRTDRS